MAVDFKSSFIPKEPITEEVFKKKKAGVFGVIVVALFVTSIIVAGGMYFYKGFIKKDIASLQSQLAESEKNIDKKTITEMSRFAARLDIVKSVVFKHQVISNVLNSLASSTASSVYFTSFSYGALTPDNLSITLEGKATSYGSVALEENALMNNKNFKSVVFSNLIPEERGLISFKANVSVDPELPVYSPPMGVATSSTDDISLDSVDMESLDDLNLDIDNL